MATYKEIQEWIKKNYKYEPKTCWIADVKEQCGLPVKSAWNRQGPKRRNPCPKEKIGDIKSAFHYFGMF